MLEQGNKAFLTTLRNKRTSSSFELWHNRLGHVAFDIVSLLQKLGSLNITSLLPKPDLCPSCQLSKSKKSPFSDNTKRALHVLDLIHCDLWGPHSFHPPMGIYTMSYLLMIIPGLRGFIHSHENPILHKPLKISSPL